MEKLGKAVGLAIALFPPIAVARHPLARVAPPAPAIISASRARVGERDGERGPMTPYLTCQGKPKSDVPDPKRHFATANCRIAKVHSITSSARARSVGSTSKILRPEQLALLLELRLVDFALGEALIKNV